MTAPTSHGPRSTPETSRLGADALLAVLVMPALAGIATWVWTGITTSQAACSSGAAIGGIAGLAFLMLVVITIAGWRARHDGLKIAEALMLILASVATAGFVIALTRGIWIITHHCAA